MFNKSILNTANQSYINSNLNSDIPSLILGNSPEELENIKELVEQIESKNKCKTKLPTWYNTQQIYYPNKLNIEQTSSEITAKYKANLVKGKSIIDLTGGFGVDAFYFSFFFDTVTHCELDLNLSEIATHNFKVLGADKIITINTDGIKYLKTSKKMFDCIYLDPSRRNNIKGKVFYLKDCLPDITEHLDLILEHSNSIMIKASPMLDISIALSELKNVREVHIIAVENEVKEVLFLIQKEFIDKIILKTANISKSSNQHFEFYLSEEKKSIPKYSVPQYYLYEPNSAILKAGAFNLISARFNINKLHKHSHLYTSETELDFPGRKFKIIEVIEYSKKNILKKFSKTKSNITTRNFPETVAQIRNKFKIMDGGNSFLFFTKNMNSKKIVISAELLKK